MCADSLQKTTITNIHLKKRISLLIENKWKILAYVILGGLAAAAISFILPKEYQADSVITFKYDSFNNNFLNNPGSLDNEIALMKSDELLTNAKNTLRDQGINIDIAELKNSFDVLYDNGSTSFVVSAVSDEAKKAAEIANTIVHSFYYESVLNDRNPYVTLLKSLQDRQKKLQDDLQSLVASQQISSFNSLPANKDKIVTQIAEFESELETIEMDNQFYQNEMDIFKKVLQNNFHQVYSDITIIDNPAFTDLRQKIERIEVQNYLSPISEKLGGFDISFPWGEPYNVSKLENFKTTFYSQLSSIVKNIADKNKIENKNFLYQLTKKYYQSTIRINAIDVTKNVIFNIMTSLEDKFNLIQFDMLDFARDLRARRFNRDLNLKLRAKINNVKSTEKNYLAEVQSIQNAQVPDTFSSPSIVLNTIYGLIIGLIIGVLISFFSKTEEIDLITSAEEVEESGFKIIAQISHFDSLEPILFDSKLSNENQKPNSKTIHSFENIRAYLRYGNLDKPLKTILVTSGIPEEGKSTIAANLAVVLANNNNKVLLVDADFIKPELSRIFKIKSTPSLAHYLFRKKELEEIIRTTYKKELDLITCIEFPQNPSAVITSERMKNFMEIVKDKYDFIIYDSSSLSLLSETTFIGQNVDEVVLVVRAEKTKFSEISQTKELLNANGISNFDVILNDV